MKTKMQAMLLALVLVFSITTTAFAADASGARLTVSTEVGDGLVLATVYLDGAQGLTNGRISTTYDPRCGTLEEAQVLLTCGASSVNRQTGEVSLAWVGSDLTGEQTPVLRLAFRLAEQDLALTAKATEAYAGNTAVAVAEGSVTIPYNPFTDIGNHWASTYILKAYHGGLFRGMTETTFGPQVKLNRAMFVTVLYRMAGSPATESSETKFSDVGPGQYYTDAVAWAAKTGVTCGVSQTQFAPGKLLDRQEAATMLYRFAELSGHDVTARADLSQFHDTAQVSDWAGDAMAWAVAEELLQGYPGSLLGARASATRAEAAAILVRYGKI